ncbi:MAG: hypothetical protein IJ418_02145 [Clostridia bacterium]|nr:hypothetical protein [Clostridia bacterium]
MYLALTGERTLQHFWQESPRSILYLCGRIHKKYQQQTEDRLRSELGDREEMEE